MEPWNIKSDDTRAVDSKKTFIIFCEDGAVEPAYFKLFSHENIQISAFGNQNQHHAQVDKATEYFRENDLLELNADGKEVLKIEEGAQVWCVFDRDKNVDDKKDTSFNDSIANAESKGIRMAWSNDDFELWVLLHFEDVDPNNNEYHHREKYYERLTTLLKELYPEESIFQSPRFDYYSTMKSKKRFIKFTYQYMKENVNVAIERAQKLENYHAEPKKPTHLQCPCTKVHLLVQELLSARVI
ncbi:MAG: RloB family protein [Bacteroidota bacterium]